MTTTGGPISTLLVSRRRRAMAQPALILDASSDPARLPSPSIASPPSPSEPPERPPPHLQTARRSTAAPFAALSLASKAKAHRLRMGSSQKDAKMLYKA
jgi:hypothetical protein